MKILAIIGSPRKTGNTYRVVEQIKEHLLKLDESIDFETIFLRDQNLQMCTGCFACISLGADKCPLKDDRAAIELKMQEADGIILAAPSYAMAVPGIMKNFIDRLAYTLHRPRFFDKSFLAVTTIGGSRGMKQTLAQLSILSAGGKQAVKLGVAMPPIRMGSDKKATKDIQKASIAFYRSLKKQQRKLPGLDDWAYFNAFKSLTSFESYQKVCPADDLYYKEKAEYFYPLKGHYVRRLVGKLFRGLMQSTFSLLVKEE
jgi:multimeric flavodoxin WrbA